MSGGELRPLSQPSAPPLPQDYVVTYNNEVYPRVAIQQQQTTGQQINRRAEFRRCLQLTYPSKFVGIISSIFLILNLGIAFIILVHKVTFETSHNWLDSIFVTKYALLLSFSNILYSVLALISIKCPHYFLIQLVSILHLISFLASIYYYIVYHSVLFIFQLISSSCGKTCILLQLVKLTLGIISTAISLTYYIRVQKYLTMLNRGGFNFRAQEISN